VPPASFYRRLGDLRRGTTELRKLESHLRHPLARIPRKLRNYRLAASHGVSVPRVLAVWAEAEQIALDDMPETFVLKSDQGAGGRGVLPLRRTGRDEFAEVAGTHTLSHEEVVEKLRHPSLAPPYFAEELLVEPGGGELPEDVKLYMFYGEVGQVMLRRMRTHADLGQARFRYMDQHGRDLGDVASGRPFDNTIATPERLGDYLDLARHLSRAIALPFVRVDLYETSSGPVFGELTRGPGGRQRYRPDHDRMLGELWDRAQYRLDLDVTDGRPLRNLHGEHPAASLYPDVPGAPWAEPAGSEQFVPVPCRAWCQPDPPSTGPE